LEALLQIKAHTVILALAGGTSSGSILNAAGLARNITKGGRTDTADGRQN
jgi:hypothetical protein